MAGKWTLKGRSQAPATTLTIDDNQKIRLRVLLRNDEEYETSFLMSEVLSGSIREIDAPPQTIPGVWWVIGVFVVATVAIIGVWLYFILRAIKDRLTRHHRVRVHN